MLKIINYLLIAFIILMIIPNLSSYGDESIIKTGITIKFDRDDKNEARIIISGENLEWSKTITYDEIYNNVTNQTQGLPTSWVENLEIILIRTLGNYSEVQYAIIECNEMANFSSLWTMCIDQRTNLELQIANKMVNKTFHTDLINNLTLEKDRLEDGKKDLETTSSAEITKLSEKNEDLNKWNSRWKWIGIIGIGIGGYFLNKYKGWGKRKHHIEAELPKDVSIGGGRG